MLYRSQSPWRYYFTEDFMLLLVNFYVFLIDIQRILTLDHVIFGCHFCLIMITLSKTRVESSCADRVKSWVNLRVKIALRLLELGNPKRSFTSHMLNSDRFKEHAQSFILNFQSWVLPWSFVATRVQHRILGTGGRLRFTDSILRKL